MSFHASLHFWFKINNYCDKLVLKGLYWDWRGGSVVKVVKSPGCSCRGNMPPTPGNAEACMEQPIYIGFFGLS